MNGNSAPAGVTKITTSSHSSSLPIGAIIGIAVAAVVLLSAAAVGAFFFIRHKRSSRNGSQKLDDEPIDPLDKPEMDGEGRTPPIELFDPHGSKLSLKNQEKGNIEMEGSKAALDAKLAAEMDGDKAYRHEMAGNGPILTGRKVAEMEGEGDVPIPIEMYAGPHGLYELDSPVVDNGPSTAGRSSAGLPTPTSGGIRSSDGGAPSPITPSSESRNGSVAGQGGVGGRRTSWTRRSKATPRLPSEAEVSSADEQDRASSSSAGGIWAPRRSSRPLGAATAFKTPQSPENTQARGAPPPPESTRDRHRRGADALTARLESNASLASTSSQSQPHSAYATPRESGSPRSGPGDRYESWNARFGSSPQPEQQQRRLGDDVNVASSVYPDTPGYPRAGGAGDTTSSVYPNTPGWPAGTARGGPVPVPRPRVGSEQSGISYTSSGGGGRRPSEGMGVFSPVSPHTEEEEEDDDVPSPQIPSPRVGGSGRATPGGRASPQIGMAVGTPSPRRSPRPPDPPTGGVGRGGFF